MNALQTVRHLDWFTWKLGIMAAFVDGIATAVVGSLGVIYLDPEHFSPATAGGFRHIISMLGICVCLQVLVSLGKFLKSNPIPKMENNGK
jgi:hypothetical protein